MRKIVSIILTAVCICSLVGTVCSYAAFGSGVEVLSQDVKLIKSGIYGKKITFSDSDFKKGLVITDFDSIKITALPSSNEGTLLLAGRRVSEGIEIKRKNISALVFIPADKDVKEAKFRFTLNGEGDEIDFIIKYTDKINTTPQVPEESESSLSVKTQREISYFGKLAGVDKENDELEFIIVSYPENGLIKQIEPAGCDYVYTPHKDFIGKDKFTYVIRDEYGNYSTVQTVNITVCEKMADVSFTDMKDRSEYNAAVAMSAMGIMNGAIIGDGNYFNPDKEVTRAEFVAMAMKAAKMKADTTLTETFFEDNKDIPKALVSYIATAQKAGIINGKLTEDGICFAPNEPITKYEASVVLARIFSLEMSGDISVFNDFSTIPTWARGAVATMISQGVIKPELDSTGATKKMTRGDTAQFLYVLAVE